MKVTIKIEHYEVVTTLTEENPGLYDLSSFLEVLKKGIAAAGFIVDGMDTLELVSPEETIKMNKL